MIIIQKKFKEKPTDKELGDFISTFVLSKGDAKMDIIYNQEETPNKIELRIYKAI